VVGRHRIEIRAPHATGKMVPAPMSPDPSEMMEEAVELLPDKYHSQSVLEEEIQSGKNVLDFELTGQ
jgi:hypothetical protein